ncbi:unnamed protein product, partial [marine sediment metagenome]
MNKEKKKSLDQQLKERLPGYSIQDMECFESVKKLGMSRDEFEMLKEHW